MPLMDYLYKHMIRAENIHKSYGSLHVLKGLQLDGTGRRGHQHHGIQRSGKNTLRTHLRHPGSARFGRPAIAGQDPLAFS